MRVKEFFKPTRNKIIIFIIISIFFPTFQFIGILSMIPRYAVNLQQFFGLLINVLIFAFYYVITYTLSCFLTYLHKKIFPKRHWKLFVVIFLVIALLANIPGIGTTTYTKQPTPTPCITQIGVSCPQKECPPDCTYSVKIRPMFWPWKQKITLDYQTGPFREESFTEIIPIIGLFNYDSYGMTYHFEIVSNTWNEEFLGTSLLIILTFYYWYLLSCLLSHIIIFSYKNIKKK